MVCLSVCVSLVSVWCVCQSVFHCSVYDFVCQSVFHWSVYGVFISLYFIAQCMVCLSVLLIAFLYSAILRSRADSLRSHVILHECIAFYSAFLNIHWCHKNLLPERVNIGTFCVHHTTMHRVTSRKATCMCFTAQCISGVVFVCFIFL